MDLKGSFKKLSKLLCLLDVVVFFEIYFWLFVSLFWLSFLADSYWYELIEIILRCAFEAFLWIIPSAMMNCKLKLLQILLCPECLDPDVPLQRCESNMTTLNWAQIYNFGFFTDFVYSYMNVLDDSNELSIAVRNPKTFFKFWAERDDYDIYLTFWGYRPWPTDQRLRIQQTNW